MSLASIQIGESFLFSCVIVFTCCRPKAEALFHGLGHLVYCKKYNKRDAIDVYRDVDRTGICVCTDCNFSLLFLHVKNIMHPLLNLQPIF